MAKSRYFIGVDIGGTFTDVASFAFTVTEGAFNRAVPAEYQNVSLYALPGGLAQVMK